MDSERLVVKLRQSVRLDRYLTQRLPRVSRTRIQRHIERGDVFVNGRPVRASHRLNDGDVVTLPGLAERRLETASQAVPFTIVHADEHLIVVDKPAGVLVHPVGAEYQRTLLNGLHLWMRERGGMPASSASYTGWIGSRRGCW
jgi:23S rRNA pseudouridine1911/1915/1917 synthase